MKLGFTDFTCIHQTCAADYPVINTTTIAVFSYTIIARTVQSKLHKTGGSTQDEEEHMIMNKIVTTACFVGAVTIPCWADDLASNDRAKDEDTGDNNSVRRTVPTTPNFDIKGLQAPEKGSIWKPWPNNLLYENPKRRN